MRPIYLTLTAPGETAPIPLDLHAKPFNVSVFIIITGTANATLQYTGDNVQELGYDPDNGNWFDHADLDGVTATAVGTIIAPVRAVRMSVASVTGSVQLQVLQAG